MSESLKQVQESPWALTLIDPVPEAFEFSPPDIFLANQQRGTAGRLSCLLTRGCFLNLNLVCLFFFVFFLTFIIIFDPGVSVVVLRALFNCSYLGIIQETKTVIKNSIVKCSWH